MQSALRETCWGNYSLFLRDDGLLIGYLETEDFEAARDGMGGLEVNARWQAAMQPFFLESRGLTPDQAMAPLAEIFHLD